MKKKIIFRADGNSLTGLGHLYRLFALVEMLKNDFDYIFVTKETSTLTTIPSTYNLQLIPKSISLEEEPKWLVNLFNFDEYIVIADGYQFKSNYQKNLKTLGFSLVYIDDLKIEHMYADVVINHSPYIKETNFNAEPYTKFALGTRYAILRPSFLESVKKNYVVDEIDTAFVCFGGADPYNLSLKAAAALLKISQIKKINVVLGGAYNHKEIFLLAKNNSTIKLHQNLNELDLFKLMNRCNFAIVPASTILYEICTIKMPILSGYFIENQKFIYSGFSDSGAIFRGDNFLNYTVIDFVNQINSIIEIVDFKPQIKAQEILFSEKIKENHLNIIKKLC